MHAPKRRIATTASGVVVLLHVQQRLAPVRRVGAALAVMVLAACAAAPREPDLVFEFKWREGEPGFEWLATCVGYQPQPGDRLQGAFEIVDMDAAMRAAGLVPGVEPTLEDFENGLRCVPE